MKKPKYEIDINSKELLSICLGIPQFGKYILVEYYADYSDTNRTIKKASEIPRAPARIED